MITDKAHLIYHKVTSSPKITVHPCAVPRPVFICSTTILLDSHFLKIFNLFPPHRKQLRGALQSASKSNQKAYCTKPVAAIVPGTFDRNLLPASFLPCSQRKLSGQDKTGFRGGAGGERGTRTEPGEGKGIQAE